MSRRKVLAVIDHDPILKDACDRMKERRNQTEQKLGFIRKQFENAIEEMHKANESDEGLIEARLREIGSLKTAINKDTHHLCIRHEEGSIDLHENGGEGLPGFLAEIIGPSGGPPRGLH